MPSTLIVESGPADGAGAATRSACLWRRNRRPEPWPGTNDVVESFEAPDPASSHDEASPQGRRFAGADQRPGRDGGARGHRCACLGRRRDVAPGRRGACAPQVAGRASPSYCRLPRRRGARSATLRRSLLVRSWPLSVRGVPATPKSPDRASGAARARGGRGVARRGHRARPGAVCRVVFARTGQPAAERPQPAPARRRGDRVSRWAPGVTSRCGRGADRGRAPRGLLGVARARCSRPGWCAPTTCRPTPAASRPTSCSWARASPSTRAGCRSRPLRA